MTYFPSLPTLAEVDAASQSLFRRAAAAPPAEQVHLATYSVSAPAMAARGHAVAADVDSGRILRSTVMKPESGEEVGDIHRRLEALAAG